MWLVGGPYRLNPHKLRKLEGTIIIIDAFDNCKLYFTGQDTQHSANVNNIYQEFTMRFAKLRQKLDS